MSVNIDLKAIDELKRKAKALEDEASVYDIGFEKPAKKNSNQLCFCSSKRKESFSSIQCIHSK